MLDPRARPPDFIRQTYKRIQKLSVPFDGNERDVGICDFLLNRDYTLQQFVLRDQALSAQALADAFNNFIKLEKGSTIHEKNGNDEGREAIERNEESPVDTEGLQLHIYESKDIPGLQLVPSALPFPIQEALLSRLLHRDLTDPQHNNNVNLHHKLSIQPQHSSYFDIPPLGTYRDDDTKSDHVANGFSYAAHDCAIHRSLSHNDFLNRKLRWITLGAQYDWTRKVYPSVTHSTDIPPSNNTSPSPQQPSRPSAQVKPSIPNDIAKLITALYPHMHPDAAIVNVYSPGDVLGVHRDVSEESDAGLVSISLGCDAVFVVGLGDCSESESASFKDAKIRAAEADASLDTTEERKESASKVIALRLRSGDILFMSGASRWAWHGVPAVLPGTCPPQLAAWPAASKESINLGSRFQPQSGSNRETNGSPDLKKQDKENWNSGGTQTQSRDRYEAWRGWMAKKRVNLNVRQL